MAAIAKIVGVSPKTIKRRLVEWGINPWVYRWRSSLKDACVFIDPLTSGVNPLIEEV